MNTKKTKMIIVAAVVSIALACGIFFVLSYCNVNYGWFMSAEEIRNNGDHDLVSMNIPEAKKWYKKAADKGDSVSLLKFVCCDKLCQLKESNTDVERRNYIDQLNILIQDGNSDGYLFLGLYYKMLEEPNPETVNLIITCYTESARMGNDIAALYLFELFADSCYELKDNDSERHTHLNDIEVSLYKEAFNKQIQQGVITADEIVEMSDYALSVYF